MVTLSRRAGKSTRSKKIGMAAIEKMEDQDKLRSTISVLMAGNHFHKEDLLEAARARLKVLEDRNPANAIIPEADLSDIGGDR